MKSPILIFITMSCLVLSCSKYNTGHNECDALDEFTSVVMVIPPFEQDDSECQTKNEVHDVDTDPRYVWAEEDIVGIFPDEGSQVYFSMASGAGQSYATFDGGGWALKKSNSYYSYFPFIPDFYIDKAAIPLTYQGQTQIGNGDANLANVGKYGYLVANGVADSSTGSLRFEYQNIGLLFRVRIPVQAGTYKSLSLLTNESVISQSGTFNAIDISYEIENPVKTNRLTLDLENVTFEQNGTLVAFMMLPPFDVLNQQLSFELVNSENVTTIASVRGRTYTRGIVSKNAPHFSISPSYVNLASDSEDFSINVLASGTHVYSVSKDVDWLTLGSNPTNGTANVSVSVAKNTGGKRTGHITVSETVNGVELKNVVNVTQYPDGFNVAITGWNDSDVDYGGVAQPS